MLKILPSSSMTTESMSSECGGPVWLPQRPDARFRAETGSDSSLFSIHASGSRRILPLFLFSFLTISCDVALPPKRKSPRACSRWRIAKHWPARAAPGVLDRCRQFHRLLARASSLVMFWSDRRTWCPTGDSAPRSNVIREQTASGEAHCRPIWCPSIASAEANDRKFSSAA